MPPGIRGRTATSTTSLIGTPPGGYTVSGRRGSTLAAKGVSLAPRIRATVRHPSAGEESKSMSKPSLVMAALVLGAALAIATAGGADGPKPGETLDQST